jgi:outer membrane protein assembly factor BamB
VNSQFVSVCCVAHSLSPNRSLLLSAGNSLYNISISEESAGSVLWKFTADDWLYSSAVVAKDGSILFGSFDQFVYSLSRSVPPENLAARATAAHNAARPTQRRQTPVEIQNWRPRSDAGRSGPRRHSLLRQRRRKSVRAGRSRRQLAGASRHSFFHRFCCLQGPLQWSFLTGGPIAASCVLGSDGLLYVPSFDRSLYALQTRGSSAGTALWNYTTDGPIIAAPTFDSSSSALFIGSSDGLLYALRPAPTPALNWTFNSAAPLFSSGIVTRPLHLLF